MSENKKITISPIPESMELVAVKTLEKPAESIGNTFADLWYLIFGGISLAAEKKKLKYAFALEELKKELTEKHSKIQPEKLLEADLQIVGAALENAKYCVEKTELRKMYVNLIASSMDMDSANYAHPVFADIIKKMTPTDACLLQVIYGLSPASTVYSTLFGDILLSFSALAHLGLIHIDDTFTHDTSTSSENFVIIHSNGEKVVLDFSARCSHISNIRLEATGEGAEELLDTINSQMYQRIDQMLARTFRTKLGYDFVKACMDSDI